MSQSPLVSVASLLLVLFCMGCGGGSSESVSITQVPTSPTQGDQGQTPSLVTSAEIALRSQKMLPGSEQVALGETVPLWMQVLATPAQAQSFFTVPGARVDALGVTFAIADEQGVARFLQLPTRAYRFVITTPDPSTVFQSVAEAGVGRPLDLQVTEETTSATLLLDFASQALGTDAGGADLQGLVNYFNSRVNSAFNDLNDLVTDRLGSGTVWLDSEFRPTEEVINQTLERANASVTFRTAQVPWNGQPGIPTQPLFLTLTFNNPLDESTVPTRLSDGWTLNTPLGPIDSSNINQFGFVGYASEGTTRDGRAVPPNTLFFTLDGSNFSEGEQVTFELSLQELPRDTQSNEILSSTGASEFATWTFLTTTNPFPGGQVESNVSATVPFQGMECSGPTNAELQDYTNDILDNAFVTPNRLQFLHQEVDGQIQIPYNERSFELVIEDEDSIQPGEIIPVAAGPGEPGFQLVVQDRRYEQQQGGPTEIRIFTADSGTITVESLENGEMVLELDVVMAASEGGAQGSYCLQFPVSIQFPR